MRHLNILDIRARLIIIKDNIDIFSLFTKNKFQNRIKSVNNINDIRFVLIHNDGVDRLIFDESFSRQYTDYLSSFWLAHILLHLSNNQKEVSEISLTNWFDKYYQNPVCGSDELRTINKYLAENNAYIMPIYNFTRGKSGIDCKKSILHTIFACWLEKDKSLTNIHPKIIINKDVWSGLNFTNKAFYVSNTVLL